MTLPFVRARWPNFLPEATESFATIEIFCVQIFQQRRGDTLIHELRLVALHSNEARQVSPYVLYRGRSDAFVLLVDLDAVTFTSQPVPWTFNDFA